MIIPQQYAVFSNRVLPYSSGVQPIAVATNTFYCFRVLKGLQGQKLLGDDPGLTLGFSTILWHMYFHCHKISL